MNYEVIHQPKYCESCFFETAKAIRRANLYIDEGTGISDWNNVHPWNAPPNQAASVQNAPAWWSEEWGYNEWNKGYSFARVFNQDSLPEVTAENSGKQAMRPHSYTWKNHFDYNNGAVAYSLGCHDSPFEFNHKMDHQKTILNHYFANDIAPYSAAGLNNLSGWTTTEAPLGIYFTPARTGNKWNNYANDAMTGVDINGGTYYPYKPGYASATNANTANRMKSAGVDCVGLVQRSASYGSGSDVNAYELSDLSGYTWTEEWTGNRRYIVAQKDSSLNGDNSYQLWEITEKADEQTPQTGLEYVIPGDIVYYQGYHVMMVAAVEYEPGTRNTSMERIRLIEAVAGSYSSTDGGSVGLYFVTNERTLSWPWLASRSWVIGRLK